LFDGQSAEEEQVEPAQTEMVFTTAFVTLSTH
jgi:hypothetical protein